MAAGAVVVSTCSAIVPSPGPATSRAAHFHHLHLNSSNPSDTIQYYSRAFKSVAKATLDGFEGFTTTSRLSVNPGNVHVLINKVEGSSIAGQRGQSAVSHIGWNVPDTRSYFDRFRSLNLDLVPMYADPDNVIAISSDALSGYLTTKQIADAKAKGATPRRVGGFFYTRGPDGVLIESYGNFPEERFTHIHLYHTHPICAQQWYARHLGATVAATHLHLGPGRTQDGDSTSDGGHPCRQPFEPPTYPAFTKDGRVREPSGYVLFDDIGLPIWPYDGDLVSSLGQAVDHIAVSVGDLNVTLSNLQRAGVPGN